MTWFRQHQTDILTGVGIVGMGAAGVLAAMKTPEAKEAVEKRKEELEAEKLPFKELVKTTWRYYIIPVTSFIGGSGCVILAHVGDKKAAAGYAAAYAASEVALSECKEKIVEKLGPKKAEEIKEEILSDHALKDPPKSDTVVITGKGDHLMRLDFCGRYFRSTVQEVENIVNRLNASVARGDEVSVADLCVELGLDWTESDSAYIWDVNRNGLIDMTKSGGVDPITGEPYVIWGFNTRPICDYFG